MTAEVSEQESTGARKLSEEAQYRVVSVYKKLLGDKTRTPGHLGKASFVDRALENSDLLPVDVKSVVDSLGGEESQRKILQRKYLLSHSIIREELKKYLP